MAKDREEFEEEELEGVELEEDIAGEEDRKKHLFIITGIAALGIVLMFGAAFLIMHYLFESSETKPVTEDKSWSEVPFDTRFVPTNAQMDQIMSRAEDDIYGEDYWDQLEDNNTILMIPGTQISFDTNDMFDSITTVAFTVMAFQNNPYALSKDHPEALRKLIGTTNGSVREFPDGTSIDLANLAEDYTEIKTSAEIDNPAHINMTGYRNGDWFEVDVDLSKVYREYYENPKGN